MIFFQGQSCPPVKKKKPCSLSCSCNRLHMWKIYYQRRVYVTMFVLSKILYYRTFIRLLLEYPYLYLYPSSFPLPLYTSFLHLYIRSRAMERIDSIHSSSSSDDNRNPKPILISTPPMQHHQSRRSISGIDILNGLKIMTSGNSILNTINNDSNIPSSPVPSQLISEHHFSQIDDFDIKEAIGKTSYCIHCSISLIINIRLRIFCHRI